MELAFKIMFLVGILYTFVSLLLSGISGAFHLGSHLGHFDGHAGGHAHAGGVHAQADGHTGDIGSHHAHVDSHGGGVSDTLFSWLFIMINPLVAVSFLTVVGGLGILGMDYFEWGSLIVLIVALAVGIGTATLLYRFVARPLYRSENSSDFSRAELIGKTAEVISSVLEDGFGEIRYTVNYLRYTAPARHIDGSAVKQGTKVIICRIEQNVFYVTELKEL